MSKYFYHGTQGRYFGMKRALEILQTGGIKCKRLQNSDNFVGLGYNGLEYVSVCKKESESDYYKNKMNAFYNFVQSSFCFVISDDVEAQKTEIPNFAPNHELLENKESIRYSDLFDEWQVREQIPLSSIIGIGIPISEIKTLYQMKPDLGELKDLKSILLVADKLGLDVIDSSEFGFVEDYESQKEKGERIAIKVNI